MIMDFLYTLTFWDWYWVTVFVWWVIFMIVSWAVGEVTVDAFFDFAADEDVTLWKRNTPE